MDAGRASMRAKPEMRLPEAARDELLERRPPGWLTPTAFALLLTVGLVLRLLFLPLIPREGPADVLNFWIPWMDRLVSEGYFAVYRQIVAPPTPFLDYPPIFPALLVLVGWLAKLGGNALLLKAILCKGPAILADCMIAGLLRSLGGVSGARAALFFFLNPAVIYVSAWWGQIDALLAAIILGALIAAAKARWSLAGLFFGLAMLVKVQAIVAAPVLIIATLRAGPNATTRFLVASASVLTLTLFVFSLFGGAGSLLEIYQGAVNMYPYLSMGAFNIWQTISGVLRHAGLGQPPIPDRIEVLPGLSAFSLGLALLIAFTALVVLSLLASAKEGQDSLWCRMRWLGLATALLWLGFFNLPTEMHERYIIPFFAFIAIPAADGWRSRALLILVTATTLLNLVAIEPPLHGLAVLFHRQGFWGALTGAVNFGVILAVGTKLARSLIRCPRVKMVVHTKPAEPI